MYKILAVIVLYNQKIFQSNTFNSLIKNSNLDLFIYDNSLIAQHQLNEFEDYIYIHDSANSGLSKAYNIAANYGREANYEWILLLDQDTTFPINALAKYIEAINANPTINLFAPTLFLSDNHYFSPTFYKHRISKTPYIKLSGITELTKYSPINSGLMININAFWDVGGYNERVRLDFSDYQFLERFSVFNKYFFVVDFTGIQSFSNEELNPAKLINRYIIFCECAVMCEKYTVRDRLDYLYIVVKRTLSLFFKTLNVRIFSLFLKHYLFAHKTI